MVSFFISTAAFLNFNTAVLLFYNKQLEDYLTDYCIGYDVIYIAFSWNKDEEAYNLMKELCKKYQVGFFDVSGEGDILY